MELTHESDQSFEMSGPGSRKLGLIDDAYEDAGTISRKRRGYK